jgi:hypothetical protein
MRLTTSLLILLISFILVSCQGVQQEEDLNPVDFAQRTDYLVHCLKEKKGGLDYWKHKRYFSWKSFNARRIIWDSWTNDFYLESYVDDFYVQMNFDSGQGVVGFNESPSSANDSIPNDTLHYLNYSKRIFAHDNFQLFMPFKLNESGVTLNYLGIDKSRKDNNVEVIEVIFNEESIFPSSSKFHVFVNMDDSLITNWVFYQDKELTTSGYSFKAGEYRLYDGILLPSGSKEFQLTDIEVTDSIIDITRPFYLPDSLSIF